MEKVETEVEYIRLFDWINLHCSFSLNVWSNLLGTGDWSHQFGIAQREHVIEGQNLKKEKFVLEDKLPKLTIIQNLQIIEEHGFYIRRPPTEALERRKSSDVKGLKQ